MILAEMQHFAAISKSYWAAPTSLGGASRNPDNCEISQMASHLGFVEDYGAKTIQINYIHKSLNGEFHLESTFDGILEITALGVASFRGNFPFVRYSYDLMTNIPDIELSAKKDWDDE